MTIEKPIRKPVHVRSVWAHNVHSEFALMETCLSRYCCASMDTEFPGLIISASPHAHHSQVPPGQNYHLMKSNVDMLHLIQVGITLSDTQGNLPDFGTDFSYVWEFNLSDFDVGRDRHNQDSIKLLKTQGMDFQKNKDYGIDSPTFAYLMVRHGLVLNHRYALTWITFHGSYDFGFLLKVLTREHLPNTLGGFMRLLHDFFGWDVYDAKHVARFCKGLYGGLENMSKTLGAARVAGKRHQAGSDSLLTLQCFMKIVEKLIDDQTQIIDRYALKNALFGLESRSVREFIIHSEIVS